MSAFNTFNRTIIIGRLGQDPELKQGKKAEVSQFSLCNSRLIDGHEEVQWHRICAFGKQAQACQKYLHKGDLCCVEGRLDAYPYEKDGERRTSHSIVADRVVFLSSKRRSDPPAENTTSEELDMLMP